VTLPDFLKEMENLQYSSSLMIGQKESWRQGYLKDLFLLIAATNDRVLNRTLVDKGHQIHAFAYAADDPQYSHFSYLSLIPSYL
jgi:siroheme synthase (precorrin-2 oxidase/ferrochelatase)